MAPCLIVYSDGFTLGVAFNPSVYAPTTEEAQWGMHQLTSSKSQITPSVAWTFADGKSTQLTTVTVNASVL